MSDDLVKRLREGRTTGTALRWQVTPIHEEAAARIEALQAEREKYRKALEEESDWDCSCDPAYYERGLRAPDCMAALVGDDVREVLGMAPLCRANVANRKAKR